jgi:hypothetical protein
MTSAEHCGAESGIEVVQAGMGAKMSQSALNARRAIAKRLFDALREEFPEKCIALILPHDAGELPKSYSQPDRPN